MVCVGRLEFSRPADSTDVEKTQKTGSVNFGAFLGILRRSLFQSVLEARFLGKPGQFNLGRLEGIGQNPSLTADRADGGESMRLVFQKEEEMPRGILKELLKEHRAGFVERFRGKGEEVS